jgi:YHS domain-containing protein
MNDSGTSDSTLLDPVCYMEVPPDTLFHTTYEGRRFLFCSRNCLAEFQKDPPKYIDVIPNYFYCPAHPQIRQAEPGNCPRCDLPLEAVRPRWVCPYHPDYLHEGPGVCPVYGIRLVPEPPGRYYSCTMHPEIKELDPGRCPKCNMKLQPLWAEAIPLRLEWHCTVHPEVIRLRPGDCPECGMKLEPREVPVDKTKGPAKEFCPKCGLEISD